MILMRESESENEENHEVIVNILHYLTSPLNASKKTVSYFQYLNLALPTNLFFVRFSFFFIIHLAS